MAKQGGLGDNLYVGGYDLSGDVGSVSRVSGGMTPIDVTAINKSAFERIGGLRDGAIEFSAYFNPAAGQAHPVLSDLPTSDVLVTYFRGTTLGSPAACLLAKQVNYDGNRAQDGSFTFTTQAQANGYGLEWGKQLTAGIRSDTAATSGSQVDFGAGTTNAMQGYLQVFSFTGTSATVTVEQSTDGNEWSVVTGSQFGTVTSGPQGIRSASFGPTQLRYKRITTSGTFTELSFAVVAVVNPDEA